MKVKGYKIEPNADLRGADLYGADLTGADLTGATFSKTKFGDREWDRCPVIKSVIAYPYAFGEWSGTEYFIGCGHSTLEGYRKYYGSSEYSGSVSKEQRLLYLRELELIEGARV